VAQGHFIIEDSLSHSVRQSKLGRTPLEEWSARRRKLCLTKHNIHNRLTSMSQMGFKLTIPASERPQTYTLDRAGIGIGYQLLVGSWSEGRRNRRSCSTNKTQ